MATENMLANLIKSNAEEIATLSEKKDALINEKTQIYQEKQSKIQEKNKSIESMSSQFSGMLKDTLEKMRNRIDAANKAWEDENERKMASQAREITADAPS